MKILSYEELIALPPLEWLVADLIPRGALAMLFGASGVGKSFIALDLAHSVVTGQWWLGHEVQQAPALYVIAEGGGGFPARARSWCEARARDGRNRLAGMGYVREPVAFHSAVARAELLAGIKATEYVPQLIVVDTLHATLDGGDESSASDMGEVIDGVKLVQRETGAATLLVHHSGWDDSRERGSSAFRAAMDTTLKLKRLEGGVLELAIIKQRDGAQASPIALRLRQVEDGMVPELVDGFHGAVTPHQRAVLAALAAHGPLGPKQGAVQANVPERSYFRAKKELEAMKAVEEAGRGRVAITERGRALLSGDDCHCQETAKGCHGGGATTAATASSLELAVTVSRRQSIRQANGRPSRNGHGRLTRDQGLAEITAYERDERLGMQAND